MTNVLITGPSSMIGQQLCEKADDRNYNVFTIGHDQCDLTDSDQVTKYFNKLNRANIKIDRVIHAAGWNGGIEWNKRFPATIYYKTAMMGLNVLTHAQRYYPQSKTISILASCSYPDLGDQLIEKHLWDGPPNNTVECHGSAKRLLDAYSRQLNKEHEYKAVTCVLTNSYGPGDSFHLSKTKVVGALIRKFVEAQQQKLPEVHCWGTGKPLREFMYCEDAANAILDACKLYEDYSQPINIGSGQEVSIKVLTEIIASAVEYTGEIIWETDKPDGQMRKRLDLTRMYDLGIPTLFWKPTHIVDGIRNTVGWYIENKEYADNKEIKW